MQYAKVQDIHLKTWLSTSYQNSLIFLVVVQCGVLLRQPDSTGRKAFVCGTYWRGFNPRQQKVVFGVILVPQSNTIMCKHNII